MRTASQTGFSFPRLAFAAFLGAVILAGPADARDPRWRPFGPGGGTVTGLALDPRNAQAVYAITQQSLYGSRDGGQTWTGLSLPSPISTVAVAPGHPATLYAAGTTILRSDDSGRTWNTVLAEPFLTFHALAVSPGPQPVAFALSESAVWRSADDGRTWTTPLTSDWPVDSLAVDPVHSNVTYVANRVGVFRSPDAGQRWAQVLDLGSQPATVQVAVAPSSPRTVYAVAHSLVSPGFTVYRSLDQGQTWLRVRDRAGSYDHALAVDSSSPKTLYLAGDDGLIGSVDGGRTWKSLQTGIPRTDAGAILKAYSLAAAPGQGQTVYAGLADVGVARTGNGGARWVVSGQTGLAAGDVDTLFFHPLRPKEVFVSLRSQADNVLRSTNNGRTWSLLPQSLRFFGLPGMAFDPSDPDLFYAATGNGLWKTEDNGNTWAPILRGQSFSAVATASPGVLLASPAACIVPATAASPGR